MNKTKETGGFIMSFKVAFIGAGSLVFARTLFTDIMSVPEFHNIEIAFTDINEDNLEKTRAQWHSGEDLCHYRQKRSF